MIAATLPLTDRDRDDWKVWIAFVGYSIGRDRLIQQHQKRYDLIRQILYQELADLQVTRLIRADLSLNLEASALIALVDGIGTGVVICPDQFSAEQQRYLVHQRVCTLQA